MAQLNYEFDMEIGQPGLLFDIGHSSVLTYRAEENIPFGLGLVKGTGSEDAKLPEDDAGVFVGISIRTQAVEQDASGEAFYAEKSAVSVLTRGRIYVKVEQDVALGDPVFLRFEVGAPGTAVGQFRKNADTDKAYLIEGARFVRAAQAGGLAVVEINLP